MKIEEIISIVANEMNVSGDFTTNKSRKQKEVYARHLCMYIIAKKNPRMSQGEIALLFNVKQPSVAKSIKIIENEIATYPTLRGSIGYLMDKIY